MLQPSSHTMVTGALASISNYIEDTWQRLIKTSYVQKKRFTESDVCNKRNRKMEKVNDGFGSSYTEDNIKY